MHGLPAGQSLQNWMFLAHMVMDGHRGKRKQGLAGMESWQRQANEAWQGKPMQNRRLQHNRPAGEAGRPLVWFHQVWRECGGAGRSEGGLGPSLLSPPTLSPLPVSVHTHSLNLPHNSTKFSPSLFLFPFYNCLPNPLYRLCPANLSRQPSLLPTPKILFRGE